MRYFVFVAGRRSRRRFLTWIKTRSSWDTIIIPTSIIIVVKWTYPELKTRLALFYDASDNKIYRRANSSRASLFRSSHSLLSRASSFPLRPFPAGMTTGCRITVFHFYVGVRRAELIPGRLSSLMAKSLSKARNTKDRIELTMAREIQVQVSHTNSIRTRLILRHDSCLE